MLSTTICTLLLASIHLISPVISVAIPESASVSLSQEAPGGESDLSPFDKEQEQALVDMLNDVIAMSEGGNALEERQDENTQAEGRSALLDTRQDGGAIARCAAEIGLAIFLNGIPITKFKRVGALIKHLGGTYKVAEMLLNARSFAALVTIGGPELAEIVSLMLGLQGVVLNCFSWV